jgi:hypothetical protein
MVMVGLKFSPWYKTDLQIPACNSVSVNAKQPPLIQLIAPVNHGQRLLAVKKSHPFGGIERKTQAPLHRHCDAGVIEQVAEASAGHKLGH